MDDREAYEFYADPANREAAGPGRKRQAPRLSGHAPVRFTAQAVEAVKGAAHAEGITVSTWIRRAVQRELERQARTAARHSVAVEGSGRLVPPRSFPLTFSSARTFSCPHFSVSNVASFTCVECGPLGVAA